MHPAIIPRRELRMSLLRLVALVAGLLILYFALPLRGERWWIGAVLGLAAVVAIAPFTLRRVLRVRGSTRPLVDAIEALVLLVVLLVLGFASVYFAVDRNGGQFEGLETRLDAMYFTVVTLGTVGFGDIHPTGQFARGVVTVQILLDFSLVALSVRVLMAAARERMEQGQAQA
jgi:hypothetical protein